MTTMLRDLVAQEYRATTLRDGVLAAERIARQADASARAQLWLLQLLLPDLVAAVEKAIVDAQNQPRVRQLAGGLLTYVYNPLDLIGDDTPLGRLDDTIICAMGLQRLVELENIALEPEVSATCDLAARSLSLLNDDLREGIEWFLRDLESSTESVGGVRVPA
jgi:uncharacterized membrane protein YkvA (DUF1232 family)